MKEDARKLPPPKMSHGVASKIPNDEILSAMLRINNFDSISSIKDESLDIDLSACVTISTDPAVMNVNSLSCTDFWRMLDESAQNPQLDVTSGSEDSVTAVSEMPVANGINDRSGEPVRPAKQDQPFSSTFLRPASFSFSPLKKGTKLKVSTFTPLIDSKKTKMSCLIKEEPPEQLLAEPMENYDLYDNQSISTNNFSLFLLPGSSSAIMTTDTTVSETPIPVSKVEHSSTSLLPPEPLFKCLDCDGLVLTGQQEFTTHELASHRILHKCNECDRDFEQQAGLKKHLKTHRSLEARKDSWKKCPDCGKCLKLGSMWMHRKIHSENKKYGCEVCGQKFVQKINLTHHARIHTAEKPFECPECKKRFQERSHLQRHQKYHAQTRSYRCDKCGKMYKTERCLKVHNLVHLEQRPFACNVCNKSFISNSKLKQHSNIHTGERPFKCNYCPRDFTNFPNWLKHTRRRHKVDHKTGEHLENIPSYCSKKPAKTLKTQKNLETHVSSADQKPNVTNNAVSNEFAAERKNQVRRKKRDLLQEVTSDQAAASPSLEIPEVNVLTTTNTTKYKRERKQLAPKQVQKSLAPQIKNELLEKKSTDDPSKSAAASHFPDLHCLSITSAEELIMEQALEMEECGLYDAPVSVVDTDNAISSSEAAAVLHFKIKNEVDVEGGIKEEFISFKEGGNRVICSSLESSPFSSPASVEITTSSAIITVPKTITSATTTANNFYMPSFQPNSQGTTIRNYSGCPMTNASPNTLQTTTAYPTPTQSTQSLINHLLRHQAPLTSMSMPLLVHPLPSVDTLFFDNTDTSYFHRKSVSQATAQQNFS